MSYSNRPQEGPSSSLSEYNENHAGRGWAQIVGLDWQAWTPFTPLHKAEQSTDVLAFRFTGSKNLSKLVQQRAARKAVTDARTAT